MSRCTGSAHAQVPSSTRPLPAACTHGPAGNRSRTSTPARRRTATSCAIGYADRRSRRVAHRPLRRRQRRQPMPRAEASGRIREPRHCDPEHTCARHAVHPSPMTTSPRIQYGMPMKFNLDRPATALRAWLLAGTAAHRRARNPRAASSSPPGRSSTTWRPQHIGGTHRRRPRTGAGVAPGSAAARFGRPAGTSRRTALLARAPRGPRRHRGHGHRGGLPDLQRARR